MNIAEIINNVLPEYPFITRIGIFGSYAKGTHTSDSDIDFVYDYDRDDPSAGEMFPQFVKALMRECERQGISRIDTLSLDYAEKLYNLEKSIFEMVELTKCLPGDEEQKLINVTRKLFNRRNMASELLNSIKWL